jgi:hypothetical protein
VPVEVNGPADTLAPERLKGGLMSNHGAAVTTEIAVTGANCPWCFNDTIESLRAEPGVVAVHGSTTGQCLRVDHHAVDVDRLVAVVRQHLHAVDVSSSEQVMVEVDARAAELQCAHGSPVGLDGSREERHV